MTTTALELTHEETVLLMTLFEGAMLEDAAKNSTYQKLQFINRSFDNFGQNIIGKAL